MRSKLNSLYFFLTAFTITVCVIFTMILIAGYDGKNGGFDMDYEEKSVTVLGNTFILDESSLEIIEKLYDFNALYVGDGIHGVFTEFIKLFGKYAFDLTRLTFGQAGALINACA